MTEVNIAYKWIGRERVYDVIMTLSDEWQIDNIRDCDVRYNYTVAKIAASRAIYSNKSWKIRKFKQLTYPKIINSN
jgi:hypothetical protein